MPPVDWRSLYASNRAVIEQSRGRALPRDDRSHPPRPQPGLATLLHVPDGLTTSAPLVCMLHGCTQDGAAFAAATRMNEAADRFGFVVAYPEQEPRANQQRCWNWFEPAHQSRGAGEPAAIVAALRAGAEDPAGPAIDPRRVFVAGLSAGGAMAAVLANAYPDVFAGVAVHSGLAYRAASGVGAAFAVMARGGEGAHGTCDVPSIVIHGGADGTVAPVNAQQVLGQLMGDAFDVGRPSSAESEQPAGGHPYTRSRWTDREGVLRHELLMVDGLGHAWSGGAPGASHTDPRGPDATVEICRFFAAVAEPPTVTSDARRLSERA
jgi:poly(hydroxyalkanoate) depolymerase family esterase